VKRPPIRVVDLTGTPFEMGESHGRTFAEEIRRYADERIDLIATGKWGGHVLDRSDVLEIAESTVPFHVEYSPSLFTEMEGLAAGSGLSMAELVVVGGFTDFVDTVVAALGAAPPDAVLEDDCTAFIVPDQRASGAGFYGQTWDMHDTATEHILLLRINPEDAPRALVFTTVGCLGQIGMNEAGIAIGINNLMGLDGRPGVTWPSVVREALRQSTIDEALAAITSAHLSGAHNYLLFDATGRGYNVEAMATRHVITELGEAPLVHTNHVVHDENRSVAMPRPDDLQVSSEARLARASEVLADGDITVDILMELTRDPNAVCQVATDPWHVESCGAAIMRPRTGDFWAVWGVPSANEYEHFSVAQERV